MNIMDWRPLVLKMCAKYSTTIKVSRVGYDDAIQAGMLGLVLAERAYDKDHAHRLYTFQAYAQTCIRNELQRLIYTDVKSSNYRIKEAPLSPEMVIELSGVAPDNRTTKYEVEEFCSKLPLDERERRFFSNIVEHGSMEAGRMYMQETGMTRAGMGLRRRQAVNAAACLYNEV